MVKRFTEQVQISPQNLSTGAASGIMSLSQRLSDFGAQIDQSASRIGAKRGQEQGEQVEQKRDPETGKIQAPEKRKASIGDILLTGGATTQAYNKTVRDGYLAGLENDTRLELAKIEQENPDNILAYNEKAEGMRKGMLKTVDPSARQAVQQFMDQQITGARIRVQGKSLQKAKAEANSQRLTAIDEAGNQAATFARGGDQLSSAQALQDAFANIDGMVKSGDMESSKAAEAKRELEREATEQGFRFKYESIAEGEDGIKKALTKIDEDRKKIPKGWTPDEWDSFISSAQSSVIRRKSINDAKGLEQSKLAKEALKDYQKAKSLGYEVSPKETARVNALIGDDLELQEAMSITNQVSSFSLLSVSDRNDALAAMQTGELDDVDLFAESVKANARINKAATEDAYSLGIRQGLVEDTAFDINDPESLAARQRSADMLSEHYGVEASPLKAAEVQLVADMIPDMTPNEKVALANTLSVAPALWGQLSEKNEGAFAMAGATGDATVMRGVFKGQQLISEKLVRLPSEADMLAEYEDLVGDAYGTQDKADLYRAVKNYYAAATKDPTGGELDSSAMEQSVAAVSGGIQNVNGFKTVVPRGVAGDDFEDLFDDMHRDVVKRLGGVHGLTDDEAAEIIGNARIVGVKDGQYIVQTDGGALMSKSDPSKPLIIEWSDELSSLNETRLKAERRSKRGGAAPFRGVR
jgi:hypothetical protein